MTICVLCILNCKCQDKKYFHNLGPLLKYSIAWMTISFVKSVPIKKLTMYVLMFHFFQKQEKIYPKSAEFFSESTRETQEPAERIVDQRNLYNETKFTSSLYRPKPARRNSPTMSERKFQKMLMMGGSQHSSAVSEWVVIQGSKFSDFSLKSD